MDEARDPRRLPNYVNERGATLFALPSGARWTRREYTIDNDEL
jgi:hypothetical protein